MIECTACLGLGTKPSVKALFSHDPCQYCNGAGKVADALMTYQEAAEANASEATQRTGVPHIVVSTVGGELTVRHFMFRDHMCARCGSGATPCVQSNPSQCAYPHAKND